VFPCPKCGSQSVVGQRFCVACGEKFPYNCPTCGAVIDPSYKACLHCHAKLRWEVQQPKPLPDRARLNVQREPKTNRLKNHPNRKFAVPSVLLLLPAFGRRYYRRVMHNPWRSSRWAAYLAGGGFVLSGLVPLGLLTKVAVPLVLSPWLQLIPCGLVVLSCLCAVTSIVLLVRGRASRVNV